MSRCKDCNLHLKCSNSLIIGKGSLRSKNNIMIIQDYPSFAEDRANSILTGDIKHKLDYLLTRAGIDKKLVYFTNAVKCSVKASSDISNKHLNACRKYLLNEILVQNPKIIITMGKWSYQILTNNKSVYEFRGHFDSFEVENEVTINNKPAMKTHTFKIMPTFSLLGSISKWENDYDIIRDFKKAFKYYNTNEIKLTEPPVVNTILSVRGLKDFIERMREVKYATTDFETTGFDFWRHNIINAGYCSKDKEADIIFLTPYKREHASKWTKLEIDRAKQINSFLKHNRNRCLKALKIVNNFEHLKLILHNGKFDSKFAEYNNIPFRNFWFDTLRADPIINENLGHALNIALERRGYDFGPYDTYLWKYINKDEKTKKSYQHVPPPLLEKYLGIDVYGDWLLWRRQIKELKKEGMWEFFFKQSMPALHDINKMEYSGVQYDKKALLDAAIIVDKKQKSIQEQIVKHTGISDPKFANSPKQIVNYMLETGYPFKKLGIKSTKLGYSTSKESLELFTKYKKWGKLPKLLLESKKFSKIRGTYIDGKGDDTEAGGFLKYLDPNNKIHTSFNLHTPRTSRYSSSSPGIQTFPRPIEGLPNTRSFIIPVNRNWMLFEADFRSVEINVSAVLSKDKFLIKQLQNNVDLHCLNAVKLGNILNTIPKWITYEHMVVSVGKQKLIKDSNVIKECLKDIEKHGKDHINFKEVRTRAKTLVFGLAYGKSGITFAKDFNIPEEEGIDMVDAYFDIYKGLYKWREAIVKEALRNGYITLLSGRKRRFTAATNWINSKYSEDVWRSKFLKEEIGRQAMNTPIQGGAHEIFEAACIRLNKRFRREGLEARLLLSIHDGIVGECLKENVKLVKKCMEEEMPQTFLKDTKLELTLGVDTDFYEYEWYGKKLKI